MAKALHALVSGRDDTDRGGRSGLAHSYSVGVLLLYPAAHLLALAFSPSFAREVVSLLLLTAAPLLAGGACLVRAQGAADRGEWIALGGAMLLWAGGMAGNFLLLSQAVHEDMATRVTMLLFVLYGVPLIFTVASPAGEGWPVRLVDGALAGLLGVLFFVFTWTLAVRPDGGVPAMQLMFDVENGFIALFAGVRFLAGRGGDRADYFGTLLFYASAYLLTAFVINHYAGDAAYGGLSDVVIGLPFILLAVSALRRPAPVPVQVTATTRMERAVRAGSPLMLPATLMMVSALLVRIDPALAITGFVTATLGYGARNVLVQMRSYDEQDRLAELSLVDALTGLPNRRRFDDGLRREWARARRSGDGLALLMIDIDHFKMLNDSYGHPVGDQRLRAVGGALAATVSRGGDLVARYGGEEFAAILPATSLVQAQSLAEAMRAAVQNLTLASPAPAGFVTVSIGVGHVDQVDDGAADMLVASADAALYAAKDGGRNRVVGQSAQA